MNKNQQWKCKRCGEMVDMAAFKCGCVVSPSPWEPIAHDKVGLLPTQETATKKMSKEGANRLLNAIMALDPDTSPEERNKKMKLQQEMEDKGLCYKCGCPIHPCLPCEEVVMLNGNHTDDTYKDLLKHILKDGRRKKNRTGVDTIGVFGAQAKYDVCMDAFPILTTKKVWFKGIVHELLWFIKGDTNIKYLVDNDVHIWDDWAYAKYKKFVDGRLAEINKEERPEPFTYYPDQKSFIERIKNDTVAQDLAAARRRPLVGQTDEEIVKIWGKDNFVEKWGELGEGTYGGMWRAFPYAYEAVESEGLGGCSYSTSEGHVDQLQKVMNKLKNNPDDRRIIVSAWHPYWVDHCALPPCHCLFHFNTEELTMQERWDLIPKYNWDDELKCHKDQFMTKDMTDNPDGFMKCCDDIGVPRRRLNCLLYQRSCDTFLGVPFNITSYSLLLAMVAHCAGMEPGVFTHTYGDLHLYVNHLDQVHEQLERTPKVLPKLWLNPKVKNLFDFKFEDIKLIGYESHPAIKGDIAV
jgi:thymidylate synthase